MIKLNSKILLISLLLVFLITGSVLAVSGRDVMEKADERNTGESRHALMGMDLVDKNGEVSPRIIEVWSEKYGKAADDLDKVIMVFHEPSSVKNTRFLQVQNNNVDDDQWIYLPALGRVRRISSSQGGDSFMGTDFSYDDMKSRELDDFTYEILKEEKLGKYETYVVEAVPKNPADEQYQKTVSWVTKKHYIPVKVEMYDKKTGELAKRMTVEQNIEKIDDIWTIFSTTMKDLESGHSTRLYIKSRDNNYLLEYNKNIADSMFTQQFLKTGR